MDKINPGGYVLLDHLTGVVHRVDDTFQYVFDSEAAARLAAAARTGKLIVFSNAEFRGDGLDTGSLIFRLIISPCVFDTPHGDSVDYYGGVSLQWMLYDDDGVVNGYGPAEHYNIWVYPDNSAAMDKEEM